MVYNRFYWVLRNFTGFYLVLLGFNGLFSVVPSLIRFLLCFTELHSLGSGVYWVLPSFTGFNWAIFCYT